MQINISTLYQALKEAGLFEQGEHIVRTFIRDESPHVFINATLMNATCGMVVEIYKKHLSGKFPDYEFDTITRVYAFAPFAPNDNAVKENVSAEKLLEILKSENIFEEFKNLE